LTGLLSRAIGETGFFATITVNQEVATRHISIKDSWEELIEELKQQWDNHPEKEIVEYTLRIKLHEGLIEQHRNMRDTHTSLL